MSRPLLKVRQHRPAKLSDPMCDFTPDELRQLIATPDERMQWLHYRSLLGPFLPAGTYEESVYFLPKAFEFILNNEDGRRDLVMSVVWFSSEFAMQLADDNLIDDARQAIWTLLDHWTSQFEVQHFGKAGCESKGWTLDYFDHVTHSDAIYGGLGDLIQFQLHQDIAIEFIDRLSRHDGNSTRAAWFLEMARSLSTGFFRLKQPQITKMLTDRALLEGAAKLVLNELVMEEPSPTYWRDTFDLLWL